MEHASVDYQRIIVPSIYVTADNLEFSSTPINVSEPIQPSGSNVTDGRKRLPLNIFSNLAWMIVNAAVLGWYTSYLIQHLGVAGFGLIPLANSTIQYASLLTQSFNSAVSRYLTINLVKEDWNEANNSFNTALVGLLIIAISLIPLVLVFAWQTPNLFNVESHYENQSRFLVLFTGLAFITTTFGNGFAVSSYAYHRFDLRLLVNILALLIQIGAVVFLFSLFSPNLWQAGLGILLYSLTFLTGHGYLWRKLTPKLKINIHAFKPRALKNLLSFSGWVAVNQAGSLLFLNIDLILANLFFGPTVGGRYGAVIIFSTLLRTLAGTVLGVLSPIVVTLFTKNEIQKLVRLIRLSVKFMGLAMALPIGLLSGFAKPLLILWLGSEFADLAILLIILVSHLCINLAITPLFYLQVATNHVRVPGIVSLISGVVNIILAISLAKWSGLGYLGIAVAGAIVLTSKNVIFTSLYGARILKLPWWTFLPSTINGAIGFLAVSIGSYLFSSFWQLNSWGKLVIAALVVSVVYTVAAFILGLSKDDRNIVRSEVEYRLKSVFHFSG
jgi:O-antigen/teichoic acid export membrane protein